MSYNIEQHAALVIVDPQRDFFEEGALPVPGSNSIIPLIQLYIDKFKGKNAPIFVTRDWHPPDHISFKAQGGPWPPHCVQNSPGAQFHPSLKIPENAIIISKAQKKDKDAYSGFQGINLQAELFEQGARRICVCGLATDYCVKATVLDGIQLGFEVLLLLDAIKGVDLHSWDSRNAISDMLNTGAEKAMIGDFR